MGVLDGNRFHMEALEAARIAKVDFIVNAVENTRRELVRCVAGDLEEAYMVGVETSRNIWTVKISARPDIVIVSPGGFPRDFDSAPVAKIHRLCGNGLPVRRRRHPLRSLPGRRGKARKAASGGG